jgi:hypothetical protein
MRMTTSTHGSGAGRIALSAEPQRLDEDAERQLLRTKLES